MAHGPEPVLDRRRRPVRRLVLVAVIAGVGRAERDALVGPRDAETVIVARVDAHIGAHRHVAGGAAGRRRALVVVVMGGRVEALRLVALQADRIALQNRLAAVRVVAVAAGDAGREHPALLEGSVVVDLAQHLAVGLIEAPVQRRHDMRLRQPAAGLPVLRRAAAPRMAQPAGLDLLAQRPGRCAAVRVACRRVGRPGDVAPLVQQCQKPLHRVIGLARRPPASLLLGPGNVARALAVAGLAADADLGPAAVEAVRGGIVVLGDARRVALGAHVVPVLVQPGPVQLVVRRDRLVRVEVEPALPALVRGPAVPGDRQRLEAAVRELDQVLLQRLDAEGVLHLEGGERAVRPVSLDHELVAVAEKARPHAEMLEGRAREVAAHRRLGRMRHCLRVLRAGPRFELCRVAAGAGLAADIARGGRIGRGRRRLPALAGAREGCCREQGERGRDRPAAPRAGTGPRARGEVWGGISFSPVRSGHRSLVPPQRLPVLSSALCAIRDCGILRAAPPPFFCRVRPPGAVPARATT